MTNLWLISQQPWQKHPLVERWVDLTSELQTTIKCDLLTLANDSMLGIMSDIIELVGMSSGGLHGGGGSELRSIWSSLRIRSVHSPTRTQSAPNDIYP